MDPNWGWFFLAIAALVNEGLALAFRHDRLQPATYWLRKVPWLIRAGLLAWLVQHFLFF